MPAKRSHTAAATTPASARTESEQPEKHQVTSADFPSTSQVIATNPPSPVTSVARFFDGQLREINLSKVRLGRFRVTFGGLDSAVTTAVVLEHDFHIKKEVCYSAYHHSYTV